MNTKYLIIGAGVSGLTFANYVKGDYLIVEKENEIGGYCRTIYKKDFVWDYAGHFFHFNTEEFKNKFINEMDPKDIIIKNKCTKIYYKETTPIKIIGFDTNNLNYENIENEEIFSLCLLHNPDKIEEILNNTSCNVALAGDTLGGEIKIPFFKGIFDNHKYNQEYYKINNTKLYISTGLGNTINMRLFNQPSINLYRLTKY